MSRLSTKQRRARCRRRQSHRFFGMRNPDGTYGESPMMRAYRSIALVCAHERYVRAYFAP